MAFEILQRAGHLVNDPIIRIPSLSQLPDELLVGGREARCLENPLPLARQINLLEKDFSRAIVSKPRPESRTGETDPSATGLDNPGLQSGPIFGDQVPLHLI